LVSRRGDQRARDLFHGCLQRPRPVREHEAPGLLRLAAHRDDPDALGEDVEGDGGSVVMASPAATIWSFASQSRTT
jgi:hypothetical protein